MIKIKKAKHSMNGRKIIEERIGYMIFRKNSHRVIILGFLLFFLLFVEIAAGWVLSLAFSGNDTNEFLYRFRFVYGFSILVILGIVWVLIFACAFNTLMDELHRREQELLDSEKKYRLLIQSANEAIFIIQNGLVVMYNPVCEILTGYTAEGISGMTFPEFIYPDDRQLVIENHRRRLQGENFSDPYVFRLVRKDGSIRWININAVLIDWQGQKATLNFMSDITAVKVAEEALRGQEELWRTLVHVTPDYIVLQDREGHILFMNHYHEDFPEKDVLGHSVYEYLPPETATLFKQKTEECLNSGNTIQVEYKGIAGAGILRFYEAYFVPIQYGSYGLIVMAISRDIDDRKQIEKALESSNLKLELLSRTDGLTGIANRRHFDEQYNLEFVRHRRLKNNLSLIMLDIDHFKTFNDLFGHLAGDVCLQKIAEVIQTSVLRPTDLAARYGGEEFICILPDTNLEGALVIAEKMRKNIETLSLVNKNIETSNHITASLGVVSINCDANETELEFLARADSALYKAKIAGRNRVECM